MRLRILLGIVILIVGLMIYAAAVAVIGGEFLPRETAIDLAFYAVAGIAWILPAAWLTRWMNAAAPHRPPPGASP
jgi:Protein of unknown function (DUF2842)